MPALKILLYAMPARAGLPGCQACADWKDALTANGLDFEERDLMELPRDVPAAVAFALRLDGTSLIERMAWRAADGEPALIAPAVLVSDGERWALIAEGTGPLPMLAMRSAEASKIGP